MKRILFFILFSGILITSIFAGDIGLYVSIFGGANIPLKTEINDEWSETYLKMPYYNTIENNYKDSITNYYGVEVSYYFLKSSAIYMSYNTLKKSFKSEYKGKYPNPVSPFNYRSLIVEDDVRFNVYQTSLGFKHKFVGSEDFFGETSIGVSVFHGTPTFMKDMNVEENNNHKEVILKDIEFYDTHYRSIGVEIGANLYKKVYQKLMFGLELKYNYGSFKIEKIERDDLIIPLQSIIFMVGLKYGF